MLLSDNTRPSKFTLTSFFSALSMFRDYDRGRIKVGLYNDLHFQNTPVYFACSSGERRGKVFDKMRVRSVVSWMALLLGADCLR